MKLIFIFILTIIAISMFMVALKALKYETDLSGIVARLLFIGIFAVVIQAAFILTVQKSIGRLLIGMFCGCIDWLLIFLLHFAEIYTEIFEGKKKIQIVFYMLATADCIQLIVNGITCHVFDVKRETMLGVDFWVSTDKTVFFYLHLAFTYMMVLMIFGAFLKKTLITPSFYRKKYLNIMISCVVAVLLNAIYMIFGLPFDISVYVYSILALAIYYFALKYKPKKLINDTLSLVVEDINDAIFCYDVEDKCVYRNKKVNEMFRDENLKEIIESRLSEYNKDNKMEFNDELQWPEKFNINDRAVYVNVLYRKLFDKRRTYIGCFYKMSDRTKEIEEFRKQHYRMTHDSLTDVYTREYFYEKVQKKLRECPDEKFYMVCSNIKGFKLYNDLFGERKGDEILIMEAELLKKYAHKSSVYGRISGDEFAVLVSKENYNEKIFIECINKMKERFNNDMYKLHIFVGIYLVDDNREAPSLICDKCRLSMEEASGDYNQVLTYYDRRMMDSVLHERRVISEFDKALETKQFQMFLQPQISSKNEIVGAEALVRWIHPVKGIIYPGEFIPVLEKTGLIYRLDVFIWEKAAEKLAQWKEEGVDLYISVNISAKDFLYIDIYKVLTELVEKYDILPEKLKLEITETVFIKELSDKKELLEKMRKFGFIIEMDDFGSGYSSLNMLKDIDVDVVKIDMAFVKENDRVERSNHILKTIIDLVKGLGMDVITEGVETKVQVDNVYEMGCELFQGYYFDRPMDIESFEKKYVSVQK